MGHGALLTPAIIAPGLVACSSPAGGTRWMSPLPRSMAVHAWLSSRCGLTKSMNTLSLIPSRRGIANFMNDIASAAAIQFIDDQSVDWLNVRRVRCQFYQRFHYTYPGPIQNLKQRLIVIPADQYGTQRLSSHTLSVSPAPDARRQQYDRFGNRIIELEVAGAHDSIWFEVMMTVESEANTN